MKKTDRPQVLTAGAGSVGLTIAAELARDFVAFSHGRVVSNDAYAPGIEIGRAADIYRSVRIDSDFGKVVVLVTDGHLPYPYGRETTGYEVAVMADKLNKGAECGRRRLGWTVHVRFP